MKKLEENLETPKDYLRKYPRICAHVICESLGYATPTTAARILMNAHRGEPDYCEWIYECYRANARDAVRDAIARRHHHSGYMADYHSARQMVDKASATGDEPVFGSWF